MYKKMIWLLLAAALLTAQVCVVLTGCSKPAEPTVTTDPAGQQTTVGTENVAANGTEGASETTLATYPTAPTQNIVVDTPDGTVSVIASEGVSDWNDTDATQATQGQQGSTTPTQGSTAGTVPPSGSGTFMSYESFIALSGAEQQKAMEAYFGTGPAGIVAFFEWKNKAEEEYNKTHQGVTGDGSFDIGDYLDQATSGNGG